MCVVLEPWSGQDWKAETAKRERGVMPLSKEPTPARLLRPMAFQRPTTPWRYAFWLHALWVIPLVLGLLGLSLAAWIWTVAWLVALAASWGWMP